eukprot:7391051-Prymnesium_polylepis.1
MRWPAMQRSLTRPLTRRCRHSPRCVKAACAQPWLTHGVPTPRWCHLAPGDQKSIGISSNAVASKQPTHAGSSGCTSSRFQS